VSESSCREQSITRVESNGRLNFEKVTSGASFREGGGGGSCVEIEKQL
jgi:hypothetical protein